MSKVVRGTKGRASTRHKVLGNIWILTFPLTAKRVPKSEWQSRQTIKWDNKNYLKKDLMRFRAMSMQQLSQELGPEKTPIKYSAKSTQNSTALS